MPRQERATPEQDERLRKAAEDGLTLNELAERFGKPVCTLRKALKRLGLQAEKDTRGPPRGFDGGSTRTTGRRSRKEDDDGRHV